MYFPLRDFAPPKIIKNRLNFAHKEKFKKSRFLPNLGVQIDLAGSTGKIFFPYIRLPPPKIIKNRLNFAHSEKFVKNRFFPNFVEITTNSAYGSKNGAVAVHGFHPSNL